MLTIISNQRLREGEVSEQTVVRCRNRCSIWHQPRAIHINGVLGQVVKHGGDGVPRCNSLGEVHKFTAFFVPNSVDESGLDGFVELRIAQLFIQIGIGARVTISVRRTSQVQKKVSKSPHNFLAFNGTRVAEPTACSIIAVYIVGHFTNLKTEEFS